MLPDLAVLDIANLIWSIIILLINALVLLISEIVNVSRRDSCKLPNLTVIKYLTSFSVLISRTNLQQELPP